MALRVGYVGLKFDARDCDWEARKGSLVADPFIGLRRLEVHGRFGVSWMFSPCRHTSNNQLRTGTDKGNLTV